MTTVSKFTTPAAAGAEVHARAERHLAAKGGTYQAAMHVVLAADPDLAQAYGMPSSRASTKPLRPREKAPAAVEMALGLPAGIEVDKRATALTEAHPSLSYAEAVGAVLAADPALKSSYARS